MNLKIQLSGFFEIFGHPCPDIQGLAVTTYAYFAKIVMWRIGRQIVWDSYKVTDDSCAHYSTQSCKNEKKIVLHY